MEKEAVYHITDGCGYSASLISFTEPPRTSHLTVGTKKPQYATSALTFYLDEQRWHAAAPQREYDSLDVRR